MTVDLAWQGGKLTSCQLLPQQSGNALVLQGDRKTRLALRAGQPVRLGPDLKPR
jgi:hypothetical protein